MNIKNITRYYIENNDTIDFNVKKTKNTFFERITINIEYSLFMTYHINMFVI